MAITLKTLSYIPRKIKFFVLCKDPPPKKKVANGDDEKIINPIPLTGPGS
jgi:hypothetical protein